MPALLLPLLFIVVMVMRAAAAAEDGERGTSGNGHIVIIQPLVFNVIQDLPWKAESFETDSKYN